MRLDLPFDALLPDGATILVAGMGGGFDLFFGCPDRFFCLKTRRTMLRLLSSSG